MANLLAELAHALKENGVERVPKGWKTAREISRECGKSLARTSEILRDSALAGLTEVRTFRIRTGGKVYPVPHYRRKP